MLFDQHNMQLPHFIVDVLSWQQTQMMLQSCISHQREPLPLLHAILLDNFQQQHNSLIMALKVFVDLVTAVVSLCSMDHMIHSMV